MLDPSLVGRLDRVRGRPWVVPMLACARVVTDRATFAWLCDVYVDRSARGLDVHLTEEVLDHLRSMGLKWILLITGDAHELYRNSGFTELSRAEDWMVLPASAG